MNLAKEKPILHTKFGTARLEKGYYVIKTSKEGNHNQPIHRLIFEDFYNMKIPEDYIIHHKNGNKTDNCILNLQLLHKVTHNKLHSLGENNPFYGKKHSDESKQKMSISKIGKPMKKDIINKISNTMNTVGFYRVSTRPCDECKLNFTWIYQYYVNGKHKRFQSVDLLKLKEKVIANGLEWRIINKEKAIKTCNDYGYNLNELIKE